MKRLSLLLILIAVLITVYLPWQGIAYASDIQPDISAPSAIVIEEKTGDVLWEKNPDEKRGIASTTKIMTALLVIELEALDTTVTVGDDVLSAGRYGIKLSVGERMSINDLLYALMLNSANDAAVVVAGHVGGSVEKFLDVMNMKALEIGAENTNYANPHGLTDGSHYSTARDLALIARYAMQNKDFARVVATKEWKLTRADPKKPAVVENRNKLLWSYPGATGIKTGYTDSAGNCLVSSAKRGDISIITVILGVRSQEAVFRESKALLDYGFSLYSTKKLISEGTTYGKVKMKYGQTVHLVAASDVKAAVRDSVDTKVIVKRKSVVRYPVKKGMVLGRVAIVQSGRTVATSDLVAGEAVKKPAFSQIMRFYINQFLGSIFKIRQAGSASNHLWGENHLSIA
ncbi:MAG TPA: D-alanyl-D-alanine carboxypeptidase family protein [Anaerolineae bacterium]|nr:D-alanyl-D-alanine carboxypeptidase family protein [Anaerolineae bacterium]